MIISLTEAFTYAETYRCGLAAVNTPFFEGLLAALEVGEDTGIPIILQCAQVHEAVMSIDRIGPAMVELARRSPAPFVLHLDHCADIDFIKRGLDMGFNSCMIDASHEPYEQNVEITREVVAMAKTRSVSVEAELGVMTGNENGNPDQGVADSSLYTDPAVAERFVAQTNVDCLAASYGTVHGIYRKKPNLDYALISSLRRRCGVPIVMHGGSGLSETEYQQAIAHGVTKINYYTYAAKAAYDGAQALVESGDAILFPNIALSAKEAAREDIARFVKTVSTPQEVN